MTATSRTTVMGPGGGITTWNGNSNRASRFDTGKLDKTRYRDALATWKTIIRKLSRVDIRYKGILNNIGIMVCMN